MSDAQKIDHALAEVHSALIEIRRVAQAVAEIPDSEWTQELVNRAYSLLNDAEGNLFTQRCMMTTEDCNQNGPTGTGSPNKSA